MYSIIFNEPGTGCQVKLVEGHLFRGRVVVSISAGDPALILWSDGATQLVGAGSVVLCEQERPLRSAPPSIMSKRKPVPTNSPPVTSGGGALAVSWHDALGNLRTVGIGNSQNGSTVKWISQGGDYVSILLEDETIGLRFPTAAAVRWEMGQIVA